MDTLTPQKKAKRNGQVTPKKKLNVRLLRRIQKHILEEPKRLAMGDLIQKGLPGVSYLELGYSVPFPKCGTAACIAGWALLLSKKRPDGDAYWRDEAVRASKVLGFETDALSGRFDALYLSDSWPTPFASQYRHAVTPEERARVAAARIEHLIKHGE